MKYLLSLFVAQLFIFSLFSQNLFSDSAVWFYSGTSGGTVPANSEYYVYKTTKDTLYQGHISKKVSRTHFRYSGDSVNLKSEYLYEVNGSIYYFNHHYNRYLLLYNYTAQIGDTLSFYLPDTSLVSQLNRPDSTFRIVVDSIKMKNYSGQSLKEFYTTQLDGFGYNNIGTVSGLSYVEKFGSKNGMLPNTEAALLIRDGSLRCYEDEQIFYNFWGQACDYRIISSLNEEQAQRVDIEVYPNPVKNVMYLNLNEKAIKSIKLFNSQGKWVKELSVDGNVIDLQNLANGVYFIRLTTFDERTLSRKIILQQ
tara:strand:- start:658 stop:1584 length:927 start_codon:yes stop_codon:yes gene_type:complete